MMHGMSMSHTEMFVETVEEAQMMFVSGLEVMIQTGTGRQLVVIGLMIKLQLSVLVEKKLNTWRGGMDKDEILKALSELREKAEQIEDEVYQLRLGILSLIDDIELYLVDAES